MNTNITRTSPHMRRGKRGFSLMATIGFLVLSILAILAVSSLTMSQVTSSRDGLKKATALSLAEAGFDDASTRVQISDGYSITDEGTTTFPATTLYDDYPATTKPSGTFSATVTYIDSETRRVTSVGTSPDGKSATVTGIVRIKQDKLGGDNVRAIKSAGDVKLTGNGSITTIPAGGHNADVESNGDIDMGGSGTTVDGTLTAMGSISGNGYHDNVIVTKPFSFVDSDTQEEWRTDWETQSKVSSRTAVSLNSNTTMTVTGPLYINGDLDVKKGTLNLRGGGKSVIYVNGDVKIGAHGTLDSTVTLVVGKTFDMTSGGTYKVTRPTLPLADGEAEPALLVYNSGGATEAISITGNSSSNHQGIVYAMKGHIKIAGGSVFTGALYNADPNGLVKGAGGFAHYFPMFGASIIDEAGEIGTTFVTEP